MEQKQQSLKELLRKGLDSKNWSRRQKVILIGWAVCFSLLLPYYLDELAHPMYCLTLMNGSRVCNESSEVLRSINTPTLPASLLGNQSAPSLLLYPVR